MTLGAMNGELFELIVFVALQQANGSGIHERNTIGGFIKSLVDYLSPQEMKNLSLKKRGWKRGGWNFGKVYQKEMREKSLTFRKGTNNVNASDTCDWSSSRDRIKSCISDSTIPEHWLNVQKNEVEEYFKESALMPWFVPACSANNDFFPEFENEDGSGDLRKLLKTLNVAALVPGSVNARFDIDAYDWPPKPKPSTPELLWKFEAKSRLTYSMAEGMIDLIDKCGDSRGKIGEFNAMLVGVWYQRKSEVHMWKAGKYHRIVVLVAARR